MGNSLISKMCCDCCFTVNAPPPTIQIETDLDYNSEQFCQFEFITFNYKGDAQYYNTESLRQLTSGILPVVVYPSVNPYQTSNSWPLFCFTNKGTGLEPTDIDPNKPYNNEEAPEGWSSLSALLNSQLEKYNYNNFGIGSLLPQSDYIRSSMKHHGRKTVSLFCALYHNQIPENYKFKFVVNSDLTFYLLNVQNGD